MQNMFGPWQLVETRHMFVGVRASTESVWNKRVVGHRAQAVSSACSVSVRDRSASVAVHVCTHIFLASLEAWNLL